MMMMMMINIIILLILCSHNTNFGEVFVICPVYWPVGAVVHHKYKKSWVLCQTEFLVSRC